MLHFQFNHREILSGCSFLWTISRSCSNMGNVCLNARSLGQIIENPCVHNREFILQWILMKPCDKVAIFRKNHDITRPCLFKYTEDFITKNWKFSDKKFWYFSHFCQNIDCGYSLEPPRRGGSNEYHNLYFWTEIRKIMYTPANPSFTK